MDVVVRAVGLEQLDAFVRLWLDAQHARRPGVQRDVATIDGLLRARLARADDSAWLLMAFADMHAIGAAHGLAAREADGALPGIVPGLMHLAMLAVAPEHWGRGVGRRLVDASIELAAARGYAALQLWTQLDNTRAIDLYRWAGFVASGRTKIDDRGEPIAHFSIALGRS